MIFCKISRLQNYISWSVRQTECSTGAKTLAWPFLPFIGNLTPTLVETRKKKGKTIFAEYLVKRKINNQWRIFWHLCVEVDFWRSLSSSLLHHFDVFSYFGHSFYSVLQINICMYKGHWLKNIMPNLWKSLWISTHFAKNTTNSMQLEQKMCIVGP